MSITDAEFGPDIMSNAAFDVVLPAIDGDPKASRGLRLHVYREPHDLTWISEEEVLPEKVRDPGANRVITSERFALKLDEVRWLRDQLNHILRIAEGER